MKKFTMGAVLAAALAVPAWAQAQTAYLSATVNLRAGPGQVYPVVAVLGSGLAINVQGCLSDYSWCDVVAGPYRGWVYGGYITYPYQGTYVPVPDYGPVIGIGIVSFTLGAYWYDHYRDRPWYAERHRWEHGPIHDGHRPPPPPPYRPSPGYQPPRFHPPRNPPPLGPGQYRTQPPEPQARPGAEGPQRFPEGPRHDPGAMRPLVANPAANPTAKARGPTAAAQDLASGGIEPRLSIRRCCAPTRALADVCRSFRPRLRRLWHWPWTSHPRPNCHASRLATIPRPNEQSGLNPGCLRAYVGVGGRRKLFYFGCRLVVHGSAVC